jgi:hypothetical protein
VQATVSESRLCERSFVDLERWMERYQRADPEAPAVLVVALSPALLRQGAVLSPRVTGAMAGLLAGLVGTSVLEINCSNFNVLHILMWHLGVAALSAVAGLVAGFIGELVVRRRSQKNNSYPSPALDFTRTT